MSTTNDDAQLIVFLAGAGTCSLDSSPKKNWVEKSGGLPNYICRIARAVMRSGKSKSTAIAIAVSRTKKWAAGGDDVDADTRAKAAAAVAEWEALKAKNKAGKVVKASREDGSDYLMLSNIGSFSLNMVQRAWQAREQAARSAAQAQYGQTYYDLPMDQRVPYTYIRETFTDYILVEVDGMDGSANVVKVPYTVDGMDVNFGDPIEVKQVWVEVDDELTDEEQELLDDILVLSKPQSDTPLSRLLALGQKLADESGIVR